MEIISFLHLCLCPMLSVFKYFRHLPHISDFSLNVFTKYNEFSNKWSWTKRFDQVTYGVRSKRLNHSTTKSQIFKLIGSLNWASIILQSFSTFAEFTEFNVKSSFRVISVFSNVFSKQEFFLIVYTVKQ